MGRKHKTPARLGLIIGLLCASLYSKGQYMAVHGMGDKSLSAAVGFSPVSVVLRGDMTYFFNDKFFVKLLVSGERGYPHDMEYTAISSGGQFFYSLFHINHTVFINTGIGPALSYDLVDEEDTTLWNYGGLATLEVETYLSHRLALLASLNETVMVKGRLKGPRMDFSLGLRVSL